MSTELSPLPESDAVKQMREFARAIERGWQMGGLTGGMYEDFAIEVAKRAVEAEREACARLCDQADKSTHPADLADAIRQRGKQ